MKFEHNKTPSPVRKPLAVITSEGVLVVPPGSNFDTIQFADSYEWEETIKNPVAVFYAGDTVTVTF